MPKLKVEDIIRNAIADLIIYHAVRPSKITLSKKVYDRFFKEMIDDYHMLSYEEITVYNGIPICIDYEYAIKIIVE